MKIVALVPMRHASKRVKGKNYRDFCGRPLYYHILSTLKQCEHIYGIVVNTDSEVITRGILDDIDGVYVEKRPENLRGDWVPMNEILLHSVRHTEADLYLQTHSTNPLLRPETITAAIEAFLESQPMYDSLFSVTRVQTRLYDQLGRAINHNPKILLKTQDLPPLWEENSNIYLFTRETLERGHTRIGDRPLMYPIDAEEAWDIDEEIDFRVTEFLYRRRYEEEGIINGPIYGIGNRRLRDPI